MSAAVAVTIIALVLAIILAIIWWWLTPGLVRTAVGVAAVLLFIIFILALVIALVGWFTGRNKHVVSQTEGTAVVMQAQEVCRTEAVAVPVHTTTTTHVKSM